jgi:uncharacterized membrane protein YgdD (TMEM256/DUF423 family)
MSARHKLNAASIHGVLFIAGLIALLTESWKIFFLLTVILIGTACYSGDIRPRGRR